MKRRIAVRGIIWHQNKLFCVRQNNYEGSVVLKNPYWCTPGGGVEEGEPLVPALERELMEEVGVVAQVGNLLYVQQFEHNDTEHLEFFFQITNGADFVAPDVTKATHHTHEIAEFAFIDPTKCEVLPKFLRTENIAEHITSHGPTKIFSLAK